LSTTEIPQITQMYQKLSENLLK